MNLDFPTHLLYGLQHDPSDMQRNACVPILVELNSSGIGLKFTDTGMLTLTLSGWHATREVSQYIERAFVRQVAVGTTPGSGLPFELSEPRFRWGTNLTTPHKGNANCVHHCYDYIYSMPLFVHVAMGQCALVGQVRTR